MSSIGHMITGLFTQNSVKKPTVHSATHWRSRSGVHLSQLTTGLPNTHKKSATHF